MKILDIALKDLTRSFRSMFAIGMMVVAPLLLTGLIYFAFGSMSGGDVSMTAIQVGVVNADQIPADAVIETPIGDNIRSMFFDESVESWITAADYADEASARAAYLVSLAATRKCPRRFCCQQSSFSSVQNGDSLPLLTTSSRSPATSRLTR